MLKRHALSSEHLEMHRTTLPQVKPAIPILQLTTIVLL